MLKDNYNRNINYLRLSITDMCNLRCLYCQTWEETGKKSHQEILRHEEIIRLARLMAELGITRIRITGGEPLVRKNVIYLLKQLSNIETIEELTLTTNATKLSQFAWQLKESGVKRLNISMDSLNKDRYDKITGGGNLNNVLAGIEEALKAGLVPLKINMVVMRGINDDEIESFARLTLEKPFHVRFIEFMPIGQKMNKWQELHLPTAIIKKGLFSLFNMALINGLFGNGPAEYYQIKNAAGSIGFISPVSNHFCAKCNRIRLTPDGYLRLCLGQENEVNIKTPMREGVSDDELKGIINQALKHKPEQHQFQTKSINIRQMVAIGG